MGEGGCNPSYFLREMEWWEILSYINGIRRRERTAWRTSRWSSWIGLIGMGSKMSSPQSLMTFPWEKDSDPSDKDEEEKVARLREIILRENEEAERKRQEK